ncbi:MAG: hypothetical protein EBT22_09870 [Chloroflexi bacterium]|nr:hypothetical protein [Chloroflexota bacterium]
MALDAFAESYHIFKTHATTVAPMMDSRAGVTRMWPGGHSYMIVPAVRVAWWRQLRHWWRL